jgi:S-(hydroxymethyl)glutathione dehydrogenase / alcohol dehydrogenase
MKIKAAVLYQTNQPLVIENSVEVPPLLSGQVLVKLAFSGVCHSQLMEARGKRGEDRFLPHLLGHEGSGIVVEIGENVKKVQPGDKVVLGWIKGSGFDIPGTQYRKGDITINSGAVTTFSEYTVVSENRIIKLAENIPLDIAVLFGCAIPTGAGIVTNTIQPGPQDTVAIFGMGGIGLSALIAVQIYNCAKVIVVDIEDEKLELAKEIGADYTINAGEIDPLKLIMELTDGVGVDYSVEAAGSTTTIEQAFESVRNSGGLCVFASHPKTGEKIQLDPHHLICGKRIQGSWGGACDPDRDIPKFFDLYREGKLPLKKLLSKRYSLDEINDALDDLENRKITRALIEIDNSL